MVPFTLTFSSPQWKWSGLLPIAAAFASLQPQCEAQHTNPNVATRPGVCRWNSLGPFRPQHKTVCQPIVIDDKTADETGSWGPWSHKPFCHDGDVIKEVRYCTFTDANFRHKHGLSIIGIPEAVSGFADALDDPLVPWDPRNRPHIPPVVEHKEGSPYTILEVPGKGMGAVANRLIRAGEILMVDHPLIIAAMDFPKALSVTQGRELLKVAVDQLPDKSRLFALAGSTGGEVIENILRTNTFGIGIHNVSYMGLYPEISRINHACNPNSFSRFHPSDLTMDVGAVRDIQPYEEITISYLPLGLTSWNRQHSIKDWGFQCTCQLCSSPDDNELSDKYRERLNEIRVELQNYQALDLPTIVKYAGELVEIVEIEGMFPHMGDYYEMLSMVFEDKGDLERALSYERKSLEMWLLYGGEDHAHVPNVERRLKKLERLK